VKVAAANAPTSHQPRRLGFLSGQASVPDDFNRMGRNEIEQLFYDGQQIQSTKEPTSMSSQSNSHPLSFLVSNTSDVLKQAKQTQLPVMITVNGEVAGVVQDIAAYKKSQEELALLRILVHGQKEIAEGKITDHNDFFTELEAENRESSK
jgi:prevent-host-death family protein